MTVMRRRRPSPSPTHYRSLDVMLEFLLEVIHALGDGRKDGRGNKHTQTRTNTCPELFIFLVSQRIHSFLSFLLSLLVFFPIHSYSSHPFHRLLNLFFSFIIDLGPSFPFQTLYFLTLVLSFLPLPFPSSLFTLSFPLLT